jgi:hypothetical protein
MNAKIEATKIIELASANMPKKTRVSPMILWIRKRICSSPHSIRYFSLFYNDIGKKNPSVFGAYNCASHIVKK